MVRFLKADTSPFHILQVPSTADLLVFADQVLDKYLLISKRASGKTSAFLFQEKICLGSKKATKSSLNTKDNCVCKYMIGIVIQT